MKIFKATLWCLPLLLVFYALHKEDTKAQRKVASVQPQEQKQVPQKIVQPKTMRIFRGRPPVDKFLMGRIPQSLESTFEKNFDIKLTRGHVFLKNVAAIPKEKYGPALGKIMHKDDLYVYIKTKVDHSHIPVALMTSTNRLYPISSIVHVKGASESDRRKLLNSGFAQYYYHAPLKFLSIDSQGENVLKIYSDLENKGYKVELEVLKPLPGAL